MSFKLISQVAQKDRITVDILHPADEATPTGVRITLASPYSPQGKAAQFAVAEFLRKQGEVGVAEFDAQALKSLVATTVAWDGVVDEADAEVPCNPETVAALYEAAPWVREQVQAAINDRARFFAPARKP